MIAAEALPASIAHDETRRGPGSAVTEPNPEASAMLRQSRPIVAALSLLVLLAAGLPRGAAAAGLEALSSKDTSAGLKAALSQGVDKAVAQLGATDGFLKNPKVTIPLPGVLEKADSTLRMLGMGGEADTLRETMNHAAEAAVGESTPVLKKALKSMTVADAKGILTGGETSATDYFRRVSSEELKGKFRPIVARATARVKLATLYNQYAGKAAGLGLISGADADMNEYVTTKALDGLFVVIADEERAIRKDPLGQASSLIKKVFGAL
jgi:hypothetical protein